MDLAEKLIELGFARDEDSKAAAIANAEAHDLSANGRYEIQDVFVRDDVVITVEQNRAPENLGGMQAVLTYPATAVIASPKGRVAFNPTDVALAEALVDDLG